MARVNLSIPDELKEAMDKIVGVNWSEVARQVFDREVRKRKRIEGMDKNSIVERLKATYEDQKEAEIDNGRRAGERWAAEKAEFTELKELERIDDDAAEALFHWSFDDTVFERWDREDFWESAKVKLGDVTPAFCEGFVEGAMDVWNSVYDEVVD